MCCFFGGSVSVADTKIFARHLPAERQALIYAMTYRAAVEVAMVLPIPGDDLQFVDLAAYPNLFVDLESMFPKPAAPRGKRGMDPSGALAVHQVGSYIASFVPTVEDFDRIDPRFRMPYVVTREYPTGFGFAVFQLADRANRTHPMAFTFRSREPSALFFPTLHVHDNESVPELEHFDHVLFCEAHDALDWAAAATPFRHRDRTHGLIGDGEIRRLEIRGFTINSDTWVRPGRPIERTAPRPFRTARFELLCRPELATAMVDHVEARTRARADLVAIDTPSRPLRLHQGRFVDETGTEIAPGTRGPFAYEYAGVVRVVFAACPTIEVVAQLYCEL